MDSHVSHQRLFAAAAAAVAVALFCQGLGARAQAPTGPASVPETGNPEPPITLTVVAGSRRVTLTQGGASAPSCRGAWCSADGTAHVTVGTRAHFHIVIRPRSRDLRAEFEFRGNHHRPAPSVPRAGGWNVAVPQAASGARALSLRFSTGGSQDSIWSIRTTIKNIKKGQR